MISVNKLVSRNFSFRKITNWYSKISKPVIKPPQPPYSHIIQIGDPMLRLPAQTIPLDFIKSDEMQSLIKHMKSVLRKYNSVGLSAPQVGIPLRMFVMEFSEKQRNTFTENIYLSRKMSIVPFSVFINPQIKVTDFNKIVFPEACESIKGFSANVPRYAAVEVTSYNEKGEPMTIEAEGWTARIIQHEVDHLEGHLYTDTMDRKTLSCTCWQVVNERSGKVELPYYPS